MENENKQICRLCLELILDGDCEVIEESKKEILEILLIRIDFDISEDAVACKRCLGKLQDCFDFKSTCFYMNHYIPFVSGDVKVDIKNVFKKVTMTSENVNLDNSHICRLCMSFTENELFNCYTSDLTDMITKCLPEVNLNSVDEPFVCKTCLSNITRYYEFMKSCEEVEQKIKNYIREVEDHDIGSKVILEEILELKNCDTLSNPLEKQWLEVENETVCLKNEEAANIKCEEIDIKEEFDVRVEVSEAVKSENDSSSGKNGSLKKMKVGKTNAKGKTFCCPKCPYSASKRSTLKTHMQSHSNNQLCTCTLCSYVTDSRLSLKAHLTKVHGGPTKAFGCHECPYETDHKPLLKQHLFKHTDQKLEHSKDIKMYKCEKCSFSTKYRISLVGHQLLHKNPEEIPKHKCEVCDFQTHYKKSLMRHMLTHKDSEVVNKFKCENCPYQCKRQRYLLQHMMNHCGNKRSFSCDQCTYSSNHKGHLQMHKRVHQKDDIRQMYKCNLCDYQAKNSTSLKDHSIQSHMDPSKLPTFQCALCPYKSILKRNLSKHITRCHNHKDQLKCASCLYTTQNKNDLKRHLLIHQKKATIKCDQCDYQTKSSISFKSHLIKIHMDISKVPTFQCALCPYKSILKANLSKHITQCHRKDQSTLKCALCLYTTPRKGDLKRHLLIHQEEATIKCDQCDFHTKYKRNLQKHNMKLHESLKCKLCDYQAENSTSFKSHLIKIHMDLSKVPTFKCTLCPYKSILKRNLSQHIKRHHNHKDHSTFECTLCGYVTKVECNLQRHMKLHQTAKLSRFKCDKCEYSTWRRDHFNQHKLRHIELSQTKAYKCETCDYQTKYKCNLKTHIKACYKMKNDEKTTIG